MAKNALPHTVIILDQLNEHIDVAVSSALPASELEDWLRGQQAAHPTFEGRQDEHGGVRVYPGAGDGSPVYIAAKTHMDVLVGLEAVFEKED